MAGRPPPMRAVQSPQDYIAQIFEALKRDPRAAQAGPLAGLVWSPRSGDTETEYPTGPSGVAITEPEDIIEELIEQERQRGVRY